jgi:prepilin-type processing-associated H-X9-DG protein
VAVILPSLGGARRRALQLKGMSNLRQMGAGWQMYANDHDLVAVPGRMAKFSGGTANRQNWYDVGNGPKYRPRWIAVLGGYVGLYAFDVPSTEDDRQDYTSELFVCPTTPGRVDERNGSYGYNYQFLGNARRSNGWFINFPVRLVRIRTFTETVMGADCMGTSSGFATSARTAYENDGTTQSAIGNHGWSLDPPRLTPASDKGTGDPGSARTAAEARHDGRANVLFTDGHGAAVTPRDLGYRVDENGAYVDDEGADGRATNRLFSGRAADDDPPAKPGAAEG